MPYLRKHSLKPLPKLKRKAEALFHQYICQRDHFICYTCDQVGNQAGHFWHNKLDFDERNIHCQCTYCNCFLHGNLGIYAVKLIDEFGREWFDKLNADAHQLSGKLSRGELELLIEKYSET